MTSMNIVDPEDRKRLIEARYEAAGRWRDFLKELDKLWTDDNSDGAGIVRQDLSDFAYSKMDELLGGGSLTPAFIEETAPQFSEDEVRALRIVANSVLTRATDDYEEEIERPTPKRPVVAPQPLVKAPQRGRLRTAQRVEPELEAPTNRLPIPRGTALEQISHARASLDVQQLGRRGNESSTRDD